MIKNIVNTFIFRAINAFLALLIVVLTARYLGAEVRGEISLFVLNATLVFQVVAIISGGSIVYYTPRRKLMSLALHAFLWSLVIVIPSGFILSYSGFLESNYLPHFIISTLLMSWFYLGMNMMLGFEWIKTFNLLSTVQLLLLLLLFGFAIVNQYPSGFEAWYFPYLISFAIGILVLKLIIFKRKRPSFQFEKEDFKLLFSYGKWAQLANIAQLLNYRLGYYLLEYFVGKTALGVYSAAVGVAEGIWIISKSFSMVVFSRIANMESRKEALILSFTYARVSLYFSLLAIAIMLLIPSSLYIYAFGEEFFEIKELLFLLSPGIAFFSLSTVYAHYFSGTGRPSVSSYSSIIGFVVTFLLGIWLIPVYEKVGVAITASASFFASTVYLMIKMLQEDGGNWQALLPSPQDITKTKEFFTSLGKGKDQ